MTTAELFSTLREMPRADKLRVMQFLIAELAKEEEPTLTHSVSAPFNSHGAAHKLAQLLESEQSRKDV